MYVCTQCMKAKAASQNINRWGEVVPLVRAARGRDASLRSATCPACSEALCGPVSPAPLSRATGDAMVVPDAGGRRSWGDDAGRHDDGFPRSKPDEADRAQIQGAHIGSSRERVGLSLLAAAGSTVNDAQIH